MTITSARMHAHDLRDLERAALVTPDRPHILENGGARLDNELRFWSAAHRRHFEPPSYCASARRGPTESRCRPHNEKPGAARGVFWGTSRRRKATLMWSSSATRLTMPGAGSF